jgi:hypothetical protein
MSASLGDKVRDTVSGFTGIVTAYTTFLHGCARVVVQPPVDKDGKLPESASFDVPQLDVLESKTIPKGSDKDGGPDKYPMKPREMATR